MKAARLRAVDANRNPMPGREPGLSDLQAYLREHPELQAPLRVWLRVLEAERDDEPTADTEDP